MKKTLISLVIFYLSGSLLANCPQVLDHEVRLLDSKETESLCQYKNKVILAVNVASRCGYTHCLLYTSPSTRDVEESGVGG